MSQLISIISPLVSRSFPAKNIDEKLSSVEWWSHARTSSDAHQLHFDLDEEALIKFQTQKYSKNRLKPDNISLNDIHPIVSCVLYIQSGSGAPTLITDQTLEEGSYASEAWLCRPENNRLLMFDGSVLHGVLPLPLNRLGSLPISSSDQVERITLMLGFWGSSVTVTRKKTSSDLHPNMQMPKVFPEQAISTKKTLIRS